MERDPIPSLEMGSWFHLAPAVEAAGRSILDDAALFGSGRAALRHLVESWPGGIRRLVVPTYYCHDVADHLSSGFEVRTYRCSPIERSVSLELEEDEVAVVVEYFGLRSVVEVNGGSVVLDRTMAPWACHTYERPPDAVFGSLRKALPVPDGGYVLRTSEIGARIDVPPVSPSHEQLVTEVLAAMEAKAAFLRSGAPSKESFLPILAEVDERISSAGCSTGASAYTRSFARSADLSWYGQIRRDNLALLRELRPAGWPGLQWSPADTHAVLTTESAEMRVRLRAALAERGVYAAVLWPLPRSIEDRAAQQLAERIVVLHVDHRYGAREMRALVSVIDDIMGVGDE